MTADISTYASDGPVLSNITLSILHDSGFYQANFSGAQELIYGRGLGCTFVNQRCEVWQLLQNNDGYFCNIATGYDGNHCSFDRYYKATCDLVTYTTPLDPYYRHFSDSPYKGGDLDSPLRDYCTMFLPVRNSDCRLSQTSDINSGEVYGNKSRCFQGNLWLKGSSDPPSTQIARCFEHACLNGTFLYIRVGSKWTLCPDRTDVSVPYYDGTLYCPPISQVCAPGETSSWISDQITNPLLNQEDNPWYIYLGNTLSNLPAYLWTIFALILVLVLIFTFIFATWTAIKRIYDRRKKKKKGKQVDENGMEIKDIDEDIKEYLREQARALSKEKWERKQKEREEKGEVDFEGDED